MYILTSVCPSRNLMCSPVTADHARKVLSRDPETMEGASGETPEPPSPGQQAGTPGPSHARGGTRHHRKNK